MLLLVKVTVAQKQFTHPVERWDNTPRTVTHQEQTSSTAARITSRPTQRAGKTTDTSQQATTLPEAGDSCRDLADLELLEDQTWSVLLPTHTYAGVKRSTEHSGGLMRMFIVIMRQQDGSGGKGPAAKSADLTEFNPWSSHGSRKEQTPRSHPLIPTCTPDTQRHRSTYIKQL